MQRQGEMEADGRCGVESGWGMMRPKARGVGAAVRAGWMALAALCWLSQPVSASVSEREPVTMSVVVVNPSADKTQTTPVRIDLPQEVTPKDVLDKGDLALEFDEDRSFYYVYKESVELKPKETRVFEVVIRDLWFVPDDQLVSLKEYTSHVLDRLKKTTYYDSGKKLADTINQRLDNISAVQNDETLSRKSRIGAYRYHLQTLTQVKEDLARMEKLLTFTGGPPVPEMLEESPLKSDAPSTTTTWLVIFLVVIFVGLLGGQFFFTWQRRSQVTQELSVVRQAAFGQAPATGAPAKPGNGSPPSPNRLGGGVAGRN